MLTTRCTQILSLFLLAALPLSIRAATALLPIRWSQTDAKQDDRADDFLDRIQQDLNLSEDQKPKVVAIVREYKDKVAAVANDSALSDQVKRRKSRSLLLELAARIKPILNPAQVEKLNQLVRRKGRWSFHPEISVTYQTYFPSDALARSIFGDSSSSFQFGLFGKRPIGSRRTEIGFSVDALKLGNSSDNLFVLSPQVTYEYRIPVQRMVTLYAKAAAGPSYMDYSFDLPGGTHLGAKRFGADGALEVGVRVGRAEVSAVYRFLTEPAGVNFDGLQLLATWTVVKF